MEVCPCNDLIDPIQLLDTAVYQLRDRLRQRLCPGSKSVDGAIPDPIPEPELSQTCSSWSNPILFDHVNVDVVGDLADIAALCNYQTMVVYQALQLIQSHLSDRMQHLPGFAQRLPVRLRLGLLSALCVAVEPKLSNRSIIWKTIQLHLDVVSSSIGSQESIEIVRFYTQHADYSAATVVSIVSSALVQNGIWRYLCCDWMQSRLHTEAVLAGLQSVSLADYFSRVNIRSADDISSTDGIAIIVALSLYVTHEAELWRDRANRLFDGLIAEAFTHPNRLIHVLDILPNGEQFRTSPFAGQLRQLRCSIGTTEGGPDSKTAKRLNRIIEAKLKSTIKAD